MTTLSRLAERARGFGRYPEPRRTVAYFSHPNVEITLVAHDLCGGIMPRHEREVLLVRNAWHPDDTDAFAALQADAMRPGDHDRVYFLCNTREMFASRRRFGFNAHFINIGCFVDPGAFRHEPGHPQDFDAVMVARFARHDGRELKRHDLGARVERLALLDPFHESPDEEARAKYASQANCAYVNDHRLSPENVAAVVRRARCSLILSQHEGICRASSESLLCGVPVVSTRSRGGRDAWYDDYNSIIVEPTPEAVRAAVETFARSPRDPLRIRDTYLAQAASFRHRFAQDVLRPIFERFDVDECPNQVAETTPFLWWPEDGPSWRARLSALKGEVGDVRRALRIVGAPLKARLGRFAAQVAGPSPQSYKQRQRNGREMEHTS